MERIEEQLELDARYNRDDILQIMSKLREIDDLRRAKNAVILAHFYQIPPIQLIADFRGDSLGLALAARRITDKRLVVSSTVHFMAEMVKLLSPEKKVVIPDFEAGCSIAEGINGEALRAIRRQFTSAAIVGYINTNAEAKAEMDSVCTSANASLVAKRISGDPVIMVPDYFFSRNILTPLAKSDSGRAYLAYKRTESGTLLLEDVIRGTSHRVQTGNVSLPIRETGTCIVHERFTPEDIARYRRQHHIDQVLAHPEVNPLVAAQADLVGGTQKMIDYVRSTSARRFLVITECDLMAPLKEAYPDREFFTPCYLCPYMKKNSIDKLLRSLREEVYEITLDDKTSAGARRSLEKMFELST